MILSRTSESERQKLRRAAGAGDQGPTEERQSGGSFPYGLYEQLHGDPSSLNRVSFPFLRRMKEDHMIGLGLHLIEMGLLKAPWYFESDSARAAAFADNLIRPIYGSLIRTILRFLWAGYSPAVKRFKFVSPTGWTYFENGVAKKVWDRRNVDAAVFRSIVPLRPEVCRPVWDASGNFDGIRYDGRYGASAGFFIIDGQKAKKINLTHSIWATHGREDEDNKIYGRPRIAPCAPIYYEYWRHFGGLARAFENNADPGPVMRYPRDDPSVEDENGDKISPLEAVMKIGRRRRSGSTVGLPSDPYTTFDDRPSTSMKYDIEYPKHETDFSSMMEWLGWLESAKLIGCWIPPEGATGSDVTGSSSNRNTVTELSNLRDESQFVLMHMIDEFIDNVFVRPAFAMNMPEFEGSIRKRTLGLSKDDEDTVRQFFQLAGQQDYKTFGVDVQRLASARGLPMLDPEEREKQLQQAATVAQNGGPPVIQPTQGRRAGVTQTGFDGDVSYVQMGGRIELSEDGDFVASLPKTEHFTDTTVLGQARLLREHTRAYLSGLFEDFAIYVSKRRFLNFDEETWSADLLRTWRPQDERERNYAERVTGTLTTIFDRAARLKLKGMISDKTLTVSTSPRVHGWMERHGQQLLDQALASVHSNLMTFLLTKVDKGTSLSDLAASIRREFKDWPGWYADRMAVAEARHTFNFATLCAGELSEVKLVQATDDGRVMPLTDAYEEDLSCESSWRLLPLPDLEIRREQLDGLSARYDEETRTILLSPELDAEGEAKYMLAIGESLTSPNGRVDQAASTNGHQTGEVEPAVS